MVRANAAPALSHRPPRSVYPASNLCPPEAMNLVFYLHNGFLSVLCLVLACLHSPFMLLDARDPSRSFAQSFALPIAESALEDISEFVRDLERKTSGSYRGYLLLGLIVLAVTILIVRRGQKKALRAQQRLAQLRLRHIDGILQTSSESGEWLTKFVILFWHSMIQPKVLGAVLEIMQGNLGNFFM